MSKQISTKTTIRNLTAEIKKTFVKKNAFTPVQTAANAAIKSLGVDGNTVNFYTSTDKSGTAAFSVDFPSELFLDQTKTTFAAKFKFDAATYPGATDPKLDGKPVMVLAVKGEIGREPRQLHLLFPEHGCSGRYLRRKDHRQGCIHHRYHRWL